MSMQLGVQMHTVRDSMTTAADLTQTLKRVRAMGYQAVQMPAEAALSVDELRRVLDGEGLTLPSTSVPFNRMRDQPDAVIETQQRLGATHLMLPSMPGPYRKDGAEGFKRFAAEASEIARRMAAAGLTFNYHHHSFELERWGGRSGLEILRDESDAAVFYIEIDTYWIQHGGGSPVDWIRSLHGRCPLVHLKDMTMRGKEQLMAEVGEGNLNWPAILGACRDAGVEWCFVEQDRCQRDPFESLEISLRNLHELGLQ